MLFQNISGIELNKKIWESILGKNFLGDFPKFFYLYFSARFYVPKNITFMHRFLRRYTAETGTT